MSGPSVVISSLWRNDISKHIVDRAEHLLSKVHDGPVRWVWVVGDSTDDTEDQLQTIAARSGKDVTIIRHDTNIVGDDPDTRMRRLCETGNAALDDVRESDDRWIIHESDLQSPVTLIEQFLATGKDVIAGWVTLGDAFYDLFGYTVEGRMFQSQLPYDPVYLADRPFQVDTVGSCFMFPAAELRAGCRFKTRGVRDLCWQMKAHGRTVWVDPRIPIVQPTELWQPQGMPQ